MCEKNKKGENMGNLGLYQWMTKSSKRVGGPLQFMGLIACGGYMVIRLSEEGIKYFFKKRSKKDLYVSNKGEDYDIQVTSTNSDGITFYSGEVIRILESDADCILIERIGDAQSPYFISNEFLKKILGKDNV